MAKRRNKNISKLEDIFVSIVTVASDETRELAHFIKNVSGLLLSHYTNYEIIIVASSAQESEIDMAQKLLDKVACVRIITLSRQSPYDTALFAGISAAVGDYVVTVNSMVDPIEVIPEIVAVNRNVPSVQAVSQVPINGGGWLNNLGRRLFYWYNRKFIGVDIPVNATYFASYSRTVINALTRSGRNHRHIRHLVRLMGYHPQSFMYEPKKSIERQRSLRTGVVNALEISASYSSHPLRFVAWLGFVAGIINILYAIYVVVINFVRNDVAEGWTTTSLQVSGMFFILFMIIVVLSEYIGRILLETRQEPDYFIADENSSAVSLADAARRNIQK